VLRIAQADVLDEGLAFRQEKTGARLVVRWAPGLKAAVGRLLVLQRRRPLPYDAINRDWLKATRSLGVQDARIHDLRAMALTAAKGQGLDATALAGHASEAQTDRYLRDREIPVVDGPRVLDV